MIVHDPKSSRGGTAWIVGGCLLACMLLFAWASGRGLGPTDDSVYLITIIDPYRYGYSLSLFGYLWHPLLLLAGGNITGLRILGVLVLLACGLVFGWAVAGFGRAAVRQERDRTAVILAIVCGIFWQFASAWLPTPSYNGLNLCGLLLFFASLLAATATRDRTNLWRATVAPALACGLALAIIAAAKPPSAVAAALIAIAWIVLLPPRRPLLCAVITALSSLVFLAAIVLGIGGIIANLPADLQRNLSAFALLHRPAANLQGLFHSLIGPFNGQQQWRIVQVSVAGLAILGTLAIAITARRRRRLFIVVAAVAAVALVIFTRTLRDRAPDTFIAAFEFWYALLGILAVLALAAALRLRRRAPAKVRLAIDSALLICLGPLAYSFGTGGILLTLMTHAAIFWIAALFLLAGALGPGRASRARRAIAFTCAATTLALLTGVMAMNTVTGAPVWRQTEPVRIGEHGVLLLDPPTARYFHAFQRLAADSGFTGGGPVIDMSGQGAALTLVLGGFSPGFPYMVDDGPGHFLFACTVLRSVPLSLLRRAWVVSGSDANLPTVKAALRCAGLGFPENYLPVGTQERADVGWRQTLWRPVVGR